MKETNKVYRIFLYVFFSFALLCSNNAKAQQKEEKIFRKINTYFGQLKKDGIQVCINNESELFKVIKQRKNKEMYNILMERCNEQVSHYGLFETDTKNLLSTLYKNEKSDFIIVNMMNPNDHSTLVSKSTFTFSRKKNNEKIHYINNDYQFNEDKQQYELVKDSSISDFNADKKMELIEDYIYYKKENSISDKKRDQPASNVYYVIAKIDGKYFIKKLRDYSSDK